MSARDKQKSRLNHARQEITRKYDQRIKERDEAIARLSGENDELRKENEELRAQLELVKKKSGMTDEDVEKFQQDLKQVEKLERLSKRFQSILGPMSALQSYGSYM